MSNVLYIKNMVCPRCIRVVREELERLDVSVRRVELGEVELENGISPEILKRVGEALRASGFELLEDRKRKIVEKIKIAVIELLHNEENESEWRFTLSAYLSRKLNMDYNYLSTLFSSVENVTIERYTILQKIERVKELLRYDDLTLSEIAYRLRYSSTQHLSNQFKQVTGLTPSRFKKQLETRRKPIDSVS